MAYPYDDPEQAGLMGVLGEQPMRFDPTYFGGLMAGLLGQDARHSVLEPGAADFASGRRLGEGAAVATDVLSSIPFPEGALAKLGMALGGATVWHGSPYKFKRFDPTKIGSGEGAQAYGYGHYVAQNPGVAQEYRNALSEPELFIKGRQIKTSAGSNMDTAKAWLQDSFQNGAKNPYADAIKKVSNAPLEDKKSVIDALKKLKASDVQIQKGGFEYKIDLPDDQIEKMLNWDQKLGKQSPEIQALAKQHGLDMDDLGGDLVAAMDAKRPAGAEAMRQAGVTGIKYFDAQSRPSQNVITNRLLRLQEQFGGDAEKAVDEFMRSVHNTDKVKAEMRKDFLKQLQQARTHNFVVFPGNEDLLNILEINNRPASIWNF